ncbi:MFS general substrate transporter [Hyaloscypha bicolor E]|uniref:MFS general substrate transporter n=1 Tax=Hyaloscypha bicolor E TaxID=1095630 RepID=A0A2J6SNI0_9HELO|nr:MFS general substrate transporter [Hyaloscypha bicolor E]PMD52337.1 MFS general substrate transporter [Hyaloscypha bicolor E]
MSKPQTRTFLFCMLGICSRLQIWSIVKDVHSTNIQGFWAVTAYQVCSTVLQPTSASASGIFGRKTIVLLGIILFTIGALLASLAQDVTLLIVGRCIQGSGGGTLMTMTFVVLTDLVSLKERGKWVGLLSMVWLVGAVLGPIIGGVFSEKVSWRWIFWVSIMLSAISLTLVISFLRIDEKPKDFRHTIEDIDWFGAFLFVSSLTSFLVPISWGGISYSWNNVRTLVPLILGLLGLVGWCFFEQLLATKPMVRLGVLGNRTAAVTYFGILIHGMASFISIYYLPLYFQTALNFSPIKAGVALLPLCLASGLSAVIVGNTIARIGLYRWAIFGGWALFIFGTGLLQLLNIGTSTPSWIFLLVVSGLGSGMLYTSLSSPAQASARDEDMATAAGLVPFFRSLGQALGIVVGDAIFQNQMERSLSQDPEFSDSSLTFAKNALALTQTIKSLPLDSPTRLHIVESFVHSLRVVWWTTLGLAVLTGLLSLLTKGLTLNRVPIEGRAVLEGKKGSEMAVNRRSRASNSTKRTAAYKKRRRYMDVYKNNGTVGGRIESITKRKEGRIENKMDEELGRGRRTVEALR